MSNYRSMIDEALMSARARLDSGSGDVVKTASATPENILIKEASELADALEYVAHSSAGTDAAGGIRGEMIRSFFKSATAGSPAQGPTTTSGTQAQAPEGSKRRIAVNNASGASPAQSSTQPEAKDGEKVMLESFKQAEGQSLYDILMASKTAGHGGPAEMTASEDAPGIPTANENSNYRSILHSNEGPVNVTKRQAKAPVRARLAEAFGSTGDTTGDAGVSAMFPIGSGKGTHKIASEDKDPFERLGKRPVDPSSYRKMRRTALKSHAMPMKERMALMKASLQGRGADKRRSNYATAGGAAAGALQGAALGADFGGAARGRNALIGGALGALTGGVLGRGVSEAGRHKAKKKAGDSAAIAAELGKTRTGRRLRSESKTMARMMAARQGRKVQGNPLVRIDRADGNK